MCQQGRESPVPTFPPGHLQGLFIRVKGPLCSTRQACKGGGFCLCRGGSGIWAAWVNYNNNQGGQKEGGRGDALGGGAETLSFVSIS